MTDTVFGLVTSSFTLGGFLGSFAASPFLDRYGRRGVLVINSLAIAVGSTLFAISNTVELLILGRFVQNRSVGIYSDLITIVDSSLALAAASDCALSLSI